MGMTYEERVIVKYLRQKHGYGADTIVNGHPEYGWNVNTIKKSLMGRVSYPVSLFSIVFLVMTLAAYTFEKSLRDHLHGKMTVLFLCNLTICFLVAALSWFEVRDSQKSFRFLMFICL